MNRIERLFETKSANILNIYFTAGFPHLEDTEIILENLAKNGVDLIEIGMPYSDPLADGPTIQESGNIALKNGMSLALLFEQIKRARQKIDTPIILMGYLNQVMQFGEQKFIDACANAGVDGLILPDLPLDTYERSFKPLLAAKNMVISFLITPQTDAQRIRKVAQLSSSFVYIVSSFAITGTQTGISEAQIAYFQRVQKMNLKRPLLIGFGISDHKSFHTACNHANGAIIGSAFIKAIHQKQSSELAATIQHFVQKIRS
jgi:tryptophan synthase alpha chain